MEFDSKNKKEDDKFERKVLVSNLPSIYDESDVRSLFANVGTVVECSLTPDELNSTTSSVVEFSSVEESNKALTLSGVSVRYHILKITRLNETPIDDPKKDMKSILEEAKEKIENAIKERTKNKGEESKKTDSESHHRSRKRHHRHSSYSRSRSGSRSRSRDRSTSRTRNRGRRRRSRSRSRSRYRSSPSKDRFGRTRKSRYKGSRSSSSGSRGRSRSRDRSSRERNRK